MTFVPVYRPPVGGGGDGTIHTSNDFEGTGASGDPLELKSARVGFIAGETIGVVADGVTDDRQNIYNAITYSQSLGADLLLPARAMNVTKDPSSFALLDLRNLKNITIRGVKGKTTLKSAAAQAVAGGPCPMVRISNCRDVVIQDIHFEGNWGNAHTFVGIRSHLQNLSSLTGGVLYVE